MPVGDLRTFHMNPRQGNVKAIAESLTINGQYRAICVNRGTYTGRPNEVLAGNHTLIAARDLGWEAVDVTYVDVDNDQAARIVAVDNRSADLGEYDTRLLAELLTELPDLDGTGFEPGDLDALVRVLESPTDPADLAAKYGEPDDAVFHPEIRLKVTPDLFDRWRTALDHYTAADDVGKLDQLLTTVERVHE